MQKTNIDKLDVRSLRILKILLESKSVSHSAENIGLSQPATSRIVGRLRNLFGDPLLVRAERGYGLTPFAKQLYPKLLTALESINATFETDEFDISRINTTVRVASTDYGIVTVLRHLYSVLLDQAPGIRLEVSNFTPQAFSLIEQGDLDLAFFANFDIPGDLHYRKLFSEDYSILVRRDHPLISKYPLGEPMNNEKLSGWPRAEMMFPSINQMHHDDVIEIDRTVDAVDTRFRLPYFLAVTSIIESTDTIVALPTRMCRYALTHYRVKVLPLQDSESFTYVTIWHHRQHQSPLLHWLVDRIAKLSK